VSTERPHDAVGRVCDGAINHAIFAMEGGSPVPPPSGNVDIWTSTAANGNEFGGLPFDCDNWRSANNSLSGRIGMADPIVTDKEWTERESVLGCDLSRRLYCFQQE
jgi:hypothetical protein